VPRESRKVKETKALSDLKRPQNVPGKFRHRELDTLGVSGHGFLSCVKLGGLKEGVEERDCILNPTINSTATENQKISPALLPGLSCASCLEVEAMDLVRHRVPCLQFQRPYRLSFR